MLGEILNDRVRPKAAMRRTEPNVSFKTRPRPQMAVYDGLLLVEISDMLRSKA